MDSNALLLVKLSSLGDVVHTFAAVTDFKTTFPEKKLCWAVEEGFAPLVACHPMVDEVISVPLRRLRKTRWDWWRDADWKAMRDRLRVQSWPVAIDAQGLIKSALLMRLAGAQNRIGFARDSAREPLASLFYQQKISVARNQHAIARTRMLFAKTFSYALPDGAPQFGLPAWQTPVQGAPVLLFHGTTWASKLLPEATWRAVIAALLMQNVPVSLVWGNAEEKARAERLVDGFSGASVLPKLDFAGLLTQIRHCRGVISVDTGLGHLAAAVGAPVLGIYGPTSAQLTGMVGTRSRSLSLPKPCMAKDCRRHGEVQENSCMAQWSAQEIVSAFEDLLNE